MASTDARPFPIKNTAFRVVFPILDADGDLVVSATGLDSEVSKDQGTFADCTNEATQIATNSGMYYLDLTSTEMNADCVAIIVKTTSADAKTTPIVLYPVEAGDIDVDVTSWNGTAVATPDTAGYPKVTIKDGTGTGEIDTTSGGVLVAAIAASAITATSIATDAITAAKIAADAIGASELAADAVTEIVNGVLDVDMTGHQTQGTLGQAIGDPVADTNTIYKATVTDATGANVAVDVVAMKVDTAAILVDTGTTLDGRIPAALISGRMDSSVGAMAANVLTATAINADAITDAKVASDVTIASVTGAVGSVTAVSDKTGYTLSTTGMDNLLDRAIAEPTGVFTWPASLRTIIQFLGALARNKRLQTVTTQTLRNDADDADIATSSTSDTLGTVTRDEWA